MTLNVNEQVSFLSFLDKATLQTAVDNANTELAAILVSQVLQTYRYRYGVSQYWKLDNRELVEIFDWVRKAKIRYCLIRTTDHKPETDMESYDVVDAIRIASEREKNDPVSHWDACPLLLISIYPSLSVIDKF